MVYFFTGTLCVLTLNSMVAGIGKYSCCKPSITLCPLIICRTNEILISSNHLPTKEDIYWETRRRWRCRSETSIDLVELLELVPLVILNSARIFPTVRRCPSSKNVSKQSIIICTSRASSIAWCKELPAFRQSSGGKQKAITMSWRSPLPSAWRICVTSAQENLAIKQFCF